MRCADQAEPGIGMRFADLCESIQQQTHVLARIVGPADEGQHRPLEGTMPIIVCRRLEPPQLDRDRE